MTGWLELQEECQYLPGHRLGEASAELACTLVAPYFSSGTSGFADAGSARRAGWRMSQFGNELAYLLRDRGRPGQCRAGTPGRPPRSVRAGAGAVRCIPIASPPVPPLVRPSRPQAGHGPAGGRPPLPLSFPSLSSSVLSSPPGSLAEDIAHFITTYGGDTSGWPGFPPGPARAERRGVAAPIGQRRRVALCSWPQRSTSAITRRRRTHRR